MFSLKANVTVNFKISFFIKGKYPVIAERLTNMKEQNVVVPIILQVRHGDLVSTALGVNSLGVRSKLILLRGFLLHLFHFSPPIFKWEEIARNI